MRRHKNRTPGYAAATLVAALALGPLLLSLALTLTGHHVGAILAFGLFLFVGLTVVPAVIEDHF